MYLILFVLERFMMYCLTFIVYGVSSLRMLSPQCLLRSKPAMLVLDIPWITPSGFIIGITKISKFEPRYLEIGESIIANSIIFSAIKDPTVSQGCCLPKIKIAF